MNHPRFQEVVAYNFKMPVSDWDLKRGEEISGYRFSNRGLLGQALGSATKDLDAETGVVIHSDGNRRLSKVGLKAIEFTLATEWFLRELDHGPSSLRQSVVEY